MVRLKEFLFQRPDWFPHEGYWRLSQVLRIGVPSILLFLAVIFLFSPSDSERVIGPIVFTCAAVISVVAIHLALRVGVWVMHGFAK